MERDLKDHYQLGRFSGQSQSAQMPGGSGRHDEYRHNSMSSSKQQKRLNVLKWVSLTVTAIGVLTAAVFTMIFTVRTFAAISEVDLTLTECLASLQRLERVQSSSQRSKEKVTRPPGRKLDQDPDLTVSTTFDNGAARERAQSLTHQLRTLLMSDFLTNITQEIDSRFTVIVDNLLRLENVLNSKASTMINESTMLDWASSCQSSSAAVRDTLTSVKGAVDLGNSDMSNRLQKIRADLSRLIMISNNSSSKTARGLSKVAVTLADLETVVSDSFSVTQENIGTLTSFMIKLNALLVRGSSISEEGVISDKLVEQKKDVEKSLSALVNSTSVLDQKTDSLEDGVESHAKSIHEMSCRVESLGAVLNDTRSSIQSIKTPILDAVSQMLSSVSDQLLSYESHFENLQKDVFDLKESVVLKQHLSLCSQGSGCEVMEQTTPKFHCFKVVSEKATWFEARRKCLALGGYLAEITDHATLDYMKRVVIPSAAGTDMWLGASDINREGLWTWSTSGGHMTVSDWYVDQPDSHGQEDCLQIRAAVGGRWNDATCDLKRSFVCQKEDNSCEGWM